MNLSYDVKIWKIEARTYERKTTYRVVWFVAKERFSEKFETELLADSFRSDLVAASRRWEAFDTVEGRPVSMLRAENMHQIYAKVIAGLEAAAHERIEKALGWADPERGRNGGDQPHTAPDDRTQPHRTDL